MKSFIKQHCAKRKKNLYLKKIALLPLLLSAFFYAHGEPLSDAIACATSLYALYHYGDLLRDLATDQRGFNWDHIRTGFYSRKNYPWIPSCLLACITLYQIAKRQFAKEPKSSTLKEKSSHSFLTIGSALMASPVFVYWSQYIGSMGVRMLYSDPLVGSSVYLSGYALANGFNSIFEHIFLHRSKKHSHHRLA